MSKVKGHYDGKVVVLDEAIDVKAGATAYIEFPDDVSPENGTTRKWHWRDHRVAGDNYPGDVSDEVIRQRRED